MDPAIIMGPDTAITAVRPMLPMITATGSGSVSGTAMAGGFAACEFAADKHSSSLQIAPAFPKIARFREGLKKWPEKTFFSGHQAAALHFGLTIRRFQLRHSVEI